jgi:glycosyltransferase involved in cell wall biosynthesis
MRIAHIVSTYPNYYGGMSNAVFQTANALENLGHEVLVLTPQPDLTPPPVVEQEKVERLAPELSYASTEYLPQIEREADDYDVVHLHCPVSGMANLAMKWKKKNPTRPLVVTYHLDTRVPDWPGLFFKYYNIFWWPRLARSADCLIGCSFDYIEASNANRIYQKNKSKWVELPFGVDVERFQPREKSADLFSRCGLDPSLPTVLFVGGMDSMHYFKGIPILLKAVALLKKENLRVQVILAGEGEKREAFTTAAFWLGIKDQVRFVGQVSDEDLPSYYNLADLLVLPSINRAEGFGTVLVEAMASGVPILTSDLPGLRTVAADGGLVFPLNDPESLAELIFGYFQSDDVIAEWKIRTRQAAVEKYSWGVIGKRLEEIYLGLVGK